MKRILLSLTLLLIATITFARQKYIFVRIMPASDRNYYIAFVDTEDKYNQLVARDDGKTVFFISKPEVFKYFTERGWKLEPVVVNEVNIYEHECQAFVFSKDANVQDPPSRQIKSAPSDYNLKYK